MHLARPRLLMSVVAPCALLAFMALAAPAGAAPTLVDAPDEETPAIINGIVDALRPMGVTDVLMPASPQNVWRAIKAAKGGAA